MKTKLHSPELLLREVRKVPIIDIEAKVCSVLVESHNLLLWVVVAKSKEGALHHLGRGGAIIILHLALKVNLNQVHVEISKRLNIWSSTHG